MTGRHLLDTSVLVAFFRGDAAARGRIEGTEVLLATVVLGELYYGVYRSGRGEGHLEELDAFAAQSTLLVCDAGTALEYGRIKNELRARGRPIPENDLWIAALARQHELTVATRDRHFHEVEGLPVEDW